MITRSAPKYSMGGQVVADSLRSLGFRTDAQGLALVETEPRWRATEVVLAQSAWNVMPYDQFTHLLRPIPAKMRARFRARRAVAQRNLRQAGRIVCLTDAMADLVRASTGRDVVVSHITAPLDVFTFAIRQVPEPFAVVPGTLTWHKRPLAALEWVTCHPEVDLEQVWFCGSDDGSGCRDAVVRRASELNIQVRIGPQSRNDLSKLLSRAAVTLLPSALESLGFSLAEALVAGVPVVASRIPAHDEVARRVGGTPPTWDWNVAVPSQPTRRTPTLAPDSIRAEWRALGVALELGREWDVN